MFSFGDRINEKQRIIIIIIFFFMGVGRQKLFWFIFKYIRIYEDFMIFYISKVL